MPFQYEDSQLLNAFHPSSISPWVHETFSIFGFNAMRVTALGIQGTPITPTWSFNGDERTGIYSPGIGRVGITLTAFPSFLFDTNSITIMDKSGKSTTLLTSQTTTNRTQTFQDADGTIALLSDISTGYDLATYMVTEAPAETPDGIITTFTLSMAAKKVLNVFINGLGGNTFSHTTGNSTLTINDTDVGDTLFIEYIKNY